MLFQLLFDQVPGGNIDLFFQGIAAKLNNVHPVIKWPRNPPGIVGSGDKQYLAQVKGHIDVVIGKLRVLLRVQNLQQR